MRKYVMISSILLLSTLVTPVQNLKAPAFIKEVSPDMVAQVEAKTPRKRSFEVNEDYRALETSIDHYLTEEKFNGVALVASGDDIILNKGFGFANAEEDIDNTSTTQFQIASVSKSFVAVAILQLVEAGALTLDTTIDKFFPDMPNANRMTIHHLLTHSSGLHDASSYEGYDEATILEDLISPAFASNNLYYEGVGEYTIYSNLGYDVLGAIVEQVTHLPYETYLEKYIFTPLGMDDSMLNITGQTIEHLATPYNGNIADGYNAKMMHPSFGYASGGIHSTVEDLYLYDRALAENTLISEESYELMIKPYKRVEGSDYSYGWFVDDEVEGLISHPGNLIGWHSMLIRHEDVTVILLTNHDESDMNMGYVIADLVLANVEDGELILE